nr:hypothetical protein [Abalone asfa-like virus]
MPAKVLIADIEKGYNESITNARVMVFNLNSSISVLRGKYSLLGNYALDGIIAWGVSNKDLIQWGQITPKLKINPLKLDNLLDIINIPSEDSKPPEVCALPMIFEDSDIPCACDCEQNCEGEKVIQEFKIHIKKGIQQIVLIPVVRFDRDIGDEYIYKFNSCQIFA